MRASMYLGRGCRLIAGFDCLACDVVMNAEAAFSGSDAVALPVSTYNHSGKHNFHGEFVVLTHPFLFFTLIL